MREISQFFKTGFHGDAYLLKFADLVLSQSQVFIETGTNVGSTLAYVARKFPHIHCFSCEPDVDACSEAVRNIAQEELANVMLFNEPSQSFIQRLMRDYIELFGKKTAFWLDAHGYGFKWPLKEEVEFVTKNFKQAFMFIDDFLVPDIDVFGYDEYNGQVCSFDYIQDALEPSREYSVYYPSYTEKTSSHHPLRGWVLIAYGDKSGIIPPNGLKDKIRIETYTHKADSENGK